MGAEDGADDRGRVVVSRDPALLRAEAEIAQARERVAQSVMKLEREITRAVDWREWVRRHPRRTLAVAFGLGWLLGRRG